MPGLAKKNFGALIIGDEILSGKRKDKHFEKLVSFLKIRGLELSWSMYLPDDPGLITGTLKSTMKREDVIFTFGGIGATPDDHTRQCAADAAGVPLELHPDAKKEIEEVFGKEAYPNRILMGIFPKNSTIIPNPYNKIPGFSIGSHHFLPGFPIMAWPMLEWILDNLYQNQHFVETSVSDSIIVEDAGESQLLNLMGEFEKEYPNYKVFSLPTLTHTGRRIELGIKGPASNAKSALNFIKNGVDHLRFKWQPTRE